MLGAVAFALVDGARAGDSSSRVTPPPPLSSAGSCQKKPPKGSPARSSLSAGDGLLAGITAAVGYGVASLVERQGLITGAAAICLFLVFRTTCTYFYRCEQSCCWGYMLLGTYVCCATPLGVFCVQLYWCSLEVPRCFFVASVVPFKWSRPFG